MISHPEVIEAGDTVPQRAHTLRAQASTSCALHIAPIWVADSFSWFSENIPEPFQPQMNGSRWALASAFSIPALEQITVQFFLLIYCFNWVRQLLSQLQWLLRDNEDFKSIFFTLDVPGDNSHSQEPTIWFNDWNYRQAEVNLLHFLLARASVCTRPYDSEDMLGIHTRLYEIVENNQCFSSLVLTIFDERRAFWQSINIHNRQFQPHAQSYDSVIMKNVRHMIK